MRGALFVAGACRYRGPLRCRARDALRAGEAASASRRSGSCVCAGTSLGDAVADSASVTVPVSVSVSVSASASASVTVTVTVTVPASASVSISGSAPVAAPVAFW